VSGGVYIYVGKTQSGKTTKALADLGEDMQRDLRPALVLDLGPAVNFRAMHHAKDRSEVLEVLFGERRTVVYTPHGEEDFDALMGDVHAAGDVHVLMDEVRWVASAHRISNALTQALRGWAHGEFGPVTYRCTSQRPGDLHRDFYACLTGDLYAFKTDNKADLDRLAEYFKPEDIAALPTLGRGEFKVYRGGF
jgi:hypothetical protein